MILQPPRQGTVHCFRCSLAVSQANPVYSILFHRKSRSFVRHPFCLRGNSFISRIALCSDAWSLVHSIVGRGVRFRQTTCDLKTATREVIVLVALSMLLHNRIFGSLCVGLAKADVRWFQDFTYKAGQRATISRNPPGPLEQST